jgi:small-conductance mechanosensitive channel
MQFIDFFSQTVRSYMQTQTGAFTAQLAGSILVMFVTLALGVSLGRATRDALMEGKTTRAISRFMGILAAITIFALGALLLLGIWGVGGFWQRQHASLLAEAPGVAQQLGLSLLILAVTFTAGRALQRSSFRGLVKGHADVNLSALISKLIYGSVLIVGALFVLAVWGVQIVIPVTVLGALGVAATFALQDVLKNIVAGIYLLVERPFRIGDTITVNTFTGTVEDVHMRVTKLRTADGQRVLIPNALIFDSAVVNTTAYQRHRLTLDVIVPAAQFSGKQSEDLLLQALSGVPGILADPAPSVTLTGVTDEQLTLQVSFWTPTDESEALSRAVIQLKTAVPAANVTVANATSAT